ncbi:hypothetical protein [Rhodocaloribacter litoris]|uniref:hypothetical protein n=1 Tax=Rhodocaloribacter litoris TaxID=2558931 RepID=UPI001E393722|nr:hypothetical protein [Rhodocaloribacter litoris]
MACLVVFFSFAAPAAFSQSLTGGARAVAIGGAATALHDDAWGHANPAVWAVRPGRAVSFFAGQAFGLPELRLGAVQYVEPTRAGAFALGARTFGFEAFRETHLDLGYARGFTFGTTRRLYAGLRLRYYRVVIARYGSGGALGVSAGWLVRILPTLYAGFQATNLNRPKLAGREEFERTLALGLGYVADERLRVLVDVIKDVRFPLSVRAGLELAPVPALALRAGATTEPTRFTAGLGVRLGRLAADVAAEHHSVLGWSPAFSLGVLW